MELRTERQRVVLMSNISKIIQQPTERRPEDEWKNMGSHKKEE